MELAVCLRAASFTTKVQHTGSAADIVQGKLSNLGVLLEEQRKRLANATGSTEDGNLGELLPKCMLADDEGCHRGRGNWGPRLTLRAEAEKALRWILEANIVN